MKDLVKRTAVNRKGGCTCCRRKGEDARLQRRGARRAIKSETKYMNRRIKKFWDSIDQEMLYY
jgi:hypothetical protein